jgi:hypothetical protein
MSASDLLSAQGGLNGAIVLRDAGAGAAIGAGVGAPAGGLGAAFGGAIGAAVGLLVGLFDDGGGKDPNSK